MKEWIIYIQKPNQIKIKNLKGVRQQCKKAAKIENRHLTAAWPRQQNPVVTGKGEKDQNHKEL